MLFRPSFLCTPSIFLSVRPQSDYLFVGALYSSSSGAMNLMYSIASFVEGKRTSSPLTNTKFDMPVVYPTHLSYIGSYTSYPFQGFYFLYRLAPISAIIPFIASLVLSVISLHSFCKILPTFACATTAWVIALVFDGYVVKTVTYFYGHCFILSL